MERLVAVGCAVVLAGALAACGSSSSDEDVKRRFDKIAQEQGAGPVAGAIQIALPGRPDAIAAQDDVVMAAVGSRLVRLDGRRNRVSGAPIALPTGILWLALGGGAAWSVVVDADESSPRLHRVTLATRQDQALPIPIRGPVAAGAGFLYGLDLLSPTGKVIQVDLRTGRETGRFDAPGDSTEEGEILPAGGAVWTTSKDLGVVGRIGVRSAAAKSAELRPCASPTGLAELAGRIWVACSSKDKPGLVALDAASGRVVVPFAQAPDRIDDVVVLDGKLLAGSSPAEGVFPVDPATGKLGAKLAVEGASPSGRMALAAGQGFVWAIDRTNPRVFRITPP